MPGTEAAPLGPADRGTEGPWFTPVGRGFATVRDQVAELIRAAILDFRFQPGQRLVEGDLLGELGVSRSTLREALRQLEAEGLILAVPRKGMFVVSPSEEEVAEVYEVRLALESVAARRFAERASPQQVASLRERLAAYERLVEDDGADVRHLLDAKDRFYGVLLDVSGSTIVKSVLSEMHARVRAVRARSMLRPGRPPEAAAELRAMLEAIEAGDPEQAARRCEEHLRRAASLSLGR
jgi:DNA-binding GntR family transcriptional regulator